MKKLLIILTALTVTLTGLIIVIGLYFSRYIHSSTQQPVSYFWQLYRQAQTTPSLGVRFNFLILGLDYRDDRFEKTQTTDTIILGSFNQARIKLISLPRDLWDYSLSTKINQIYPSSLDQEDRFDYIQSNFSRLTGQPINRTLIITTDDLIDLINLAGPLTVYLDQGFTDNQYPNPDYIKNPNPKTPVYKTVEFPSGWLTLDSSNITEFVRSRKSSQGGTDIGRIKRQQLVIDALIQRLISFDYLAHPGHLTALYRFWQQQITTNLTDTDLASILVTNGLKLKDLHLTKIELPIGNKAGEGVIYHPLSFYHPAWVFIPTDKDYGRLQSYIHQNLL